MAEAVPKMVSLELDDDDKSDADPTVKALSPDYSWGTRIQLTERELVKLGLAHDGVEIGEIVHGHFMARVVGRRHNIDDSSETCCVTLQIEDLAIESEDQENAEEDEDEG